MTVEDKLDVEWPKQDSLKKQANETEMPDKNALFKFMDRATMHGLGRIANANTKYTALLWTFILVCFLTYLAYAVYGLHKKLTEYHVKVDIKTVTMNSLPFPAVTFCGMSPAHLGFSQINNKNGNKELYKNTNHLLERYRELNQSFERVQTSKEMILVDKNGKMPFCYYDEEFCSFDDFKFFSTMKKGDCYTFNYKGTAMQILANHDAGLFIVFNTDNGQNVDGRASHLQSSSGIEVFIHSPEMRNPTHHGGLAITPGKKTRIELAKVKIKRLPSPYTDKCENLNAEDGDLSLCQTKCLAKTQLQNCSVVSPKLAHTLIDRNDSDWQIWKSIADSDNKTQVQCTMAIMKAYAEDRVPCNCKLPCKQDRFYKTVSSSNWPHKSSRPHITAGINERFQYNFTEEHITATFAALEVFFRELSFQEIAHYPLYDFNEFTYDLGGLLGLIVGASAFSALEIIAFIAQVCLSNIKRAFHSSRIAKAEFKS